MATGAGQAGSSLIPHQLLGLSVEPGGPAGAFGGRMLNGRGYLRVNKGPLQEAAPV